MQDRLESFGHGDVPVVFAHANGFPPGSYRRFFEHLADRCSITAYRHRPLWDQATPPPNLNWSLFVDDLVDYLKTRGGEPVWMMGHSLGGAVSIMAAVRHPDLFRALILIDPVLFRTRRALGYRLLPKTRRRRNPMVRGALRRPHQFDSYQAAFDFYRGKRAFAGMDDNALWDYVHASKIPGEEGGVRLAYPGAWEAGVYASPPWIWPRIMRLNLPTLGLVARESDVITPGAFRRWQRLQPDADLQLCPGGHLLPLERPDETARRVLDFLERQGA